MKRNEPLTPTSGNVIQLKPASAAALPLDREKLAGDLMRVITEVLEAHPTSALTSVIVTANGSNATVTVLDAQLTTVSASSPESA
jgi:hypothetical protein